MNKLYLTMLLASVSVCAQETLPLEMYYSPDGRILYTGGQPQSGWYDKTTVRNVYLNFNEANYWSLLTANYASETNLAATMIVDGITYPNVGVRFRGNTSYMQTGTSQKKSFAVDTDYLDPNQTVMGYKGLKFNNAHQDPTFMREVLYGRMASRYTPIAKANYIHLYLNNQDWGVYPNVQSVDKTFLESYFLSNDGPRWRATNEETGNPPPNWGDGTAAMNYISADTLAYKQYYGLKSSDISYPWQKLVDACQMLSTATASNTDAVKSKIDVDKVLWFLAVENIFTDDDSYIMKGKMDYCVYYEPETGRTTPLEYDGNSTFQSSAATSASWGPFKNANNANYPLLNKLLSIPEWRQRYLAHYRTILTESFTTANANAIIDELDAQISALVAADTKKLYSTTQYTSGVPALKTFVANRRNFLLSNAEVAQTGPVIASAPFYNAALAEYERPLPQEPAVVRATVTSASGINKVWLYYATGLVGNFSKTQMFDDGAHEDGAANDGVFGAQIPGYAANTLVRYYIEAIANNAALSASYLPAGAEHDIFVYRVAQVDAPNGVVINEILASNTAGAVDEAGQYEDWVELYNNNTDPVDLSGYFLSDDTTWLNKWQIPAGTVIPGNGYLIIWADDDVADGPLHTTWKLSAGGESVTLSNPQQQVVDQLIFGAQQTDVAYARIPNGTGSFVAQAATFGFNNESLSVGEHASAGSFTLYPNPAGSFVVIRADALLAGQTAEVYNLVGQKVAAVALSGHDVLQTGQWPVGMYVVRVQDISTKLIIAR